MHEIIIKNARKGKEKGPKSQQFQLRSDKKG
jgi:hypothetical protein